MRRRVAWGKFSGPAFARALETEQQKLISIVEYSPDFIGVADLNQNALFVNRAGQALVGLESDEEIRRTKIVDDFPEDREKIKNEDLYPGQVWPPITRCGENTFFRKGARRFRGPRGLPQGSRPCPS